MGAADAISHGSQRRALLDLESLDTAGNKNPQPLWNYSAETLDPLDHFTYGG